VNDEQRKTRAASGPLEPHVAARDRNHALSHSSTIANRRVSRTVTPIVVDTGLFRGADLSQGGGDGGKTISLISRSA
jgi:hypothetical protein